jgi:hypothetical protein
MVVVHACIMDIMWLFATVAPPAALGVSLGSAAPLGVSLGSVVAPPPPSRSLCAAAPALAAISRLGRRPPHPRILGVAALGKVLPFLISISLMYCGSIPCMSFGGIASTSQRNPLPYIMIMAHARSTINRAPPRQLWPRVR